MTQTSIDLVLLDCEMAEMTGLETLREIRRHHGSTNVIMLSDGSTRNENSEAMAKELGALGFLYKPASQGGNGELLTSIKSLMQKVHIHRNLRGTVLAAPKGEVIRTAAAAPASPSLPVQAKGFPKASRIDVVLIGVSTGGPEALMQLIPSLPADLGVPVLIVQHMPPLFTASLARDLDRRSALSVKEAAQGEAIHPNVVLIAPGGRHMIVRARPDLVHGGQELLIGFDDGPPENSCRPAVDVLFRSAARHYAGRALAVVMTGMGSDGCEGIRALKHAGCLAITQSEKTCVVYGMPLAVDEAGLSDEQVPLPMLAARITRAVMGEHA
jgi:two-component system chemotaxis response regulator CheB